MVDFKISVALVLLHEGEEYTNDPNDAGGPTKWGITIPDLPPGGTAADIQSLTRDQATAIYKAKYWDRIRGDELISQDVADVFMDLAVCKGLQGATDLIRAGLGIPRKIVAWGRLDDETLKAVNSVPHGTQLCFDTLRLCDAGRIARVRSDASQAEFLPGWLRRNSHTLAHILGLYMEW